MPFAKIINWNLFYFCCGTRRAFLSTSSVDAEWNPANVMAMRKHHLLIILFTCCIICGIAVALVLHLHQKHHVEPLPARHEIEQHMLFTSNMHDAELHAASCCTTSGTLVVKKKAGGLLSHLPVVGHLIGPFCRTATLAPECSTCIPVHLASARACGATSLVSGRGSLLTNLPVHLRRESLLYCSRHRRLLHTPSVATCQRPIAFPGMVGTTICRRRPMHHC